MFFFFELHDLQRHFKNTIFMKNRSSYRTEDIWGVKPYSWATLGFWSQLWFCVLCLSKGFSLTWDTVALCLSDTLGPAHSGERESTEVCGPFVIPPRPDCKLPKEQACFIWHGCPRRSQHRRVTYSYRRTLGWLKISSMWLSPQTLLSATVT